MLRYFVFCGGFQAGSYDFYVGVNRLTQRYRWPLLLVRFAMFRVYPGWWRLRQGVP